MGTSSKKLIKVKGLEVISENSEANTKNNNKELSPHLPTTSSTKDADEKAKRNKDLNKFIPYINFSDLFNYDDSIEGCMKNIQNIYLQKLSNIKKWYLYSFKSNTIEDMTSPEGKRRK